MPYFRRRSLWVSLVMCLCCPLWLMGASSSSSSRSSSPSMSSSSPSRSSSSSVSGGYGTSSKSSAPPPTTTAPSSSPSQPSSNPARGASEWGSGGYGQSASPSQVNYFLLGHTAPGRQEHGFMTTPTPSSARPTSPPAVSGGYGQSATTLTRQDLTPVDRALAASVAQTGKPVTSRREAEARLRSTVATQHYAQEPALRPAYVPQTVVYQGSTRPVIFMGGGYGYYDYQSSWIPLSAADYLISDAHIDTVPRVKRRHRIWPWVLGGLIIVGGVGAVIYLVRKE